MLNPTRIAAVCASTMMMCLGTSVGAMAQAPTAQDTARRCEVRPEGQRETVRKTRFGGGFYFEQDSVLPWLGRWGGDQNYTMGLAFPVVGHWIEEKGLDWALRGVDCFTGVLKAHQDVLAFSDPDAYENSSLVLGYTAFTPRRLDLLTPIHDDRPYAGLLYLSTARLTADPYARRALRSELTLGVLGLRIGEAVQTWIHTGRRKKNGPGALTPYDPKGWPLQISDGGEPTAKYTLSLTKAPSESEFHDVAWSTEASVGYYTNVAVGATARIGRLRSPFWAHNSNPLSAANQRLVTSDDRESHRDKPCHPLRGEMNVPACRASKNFELAAFASGRLRLVGYNALLQGQFRRSPVTFNSAQINRVILEGEVGVSAGLKGCSAVLTFARRSAEFLVGQTRAHTFGGIHLVCTRGLRATQNKQQ